MGNDRKLAGYSVQKMDSWKICDRRRIVQKLDSGGEISSQEANEVPSRNHRGSEAGEVRRLHLTVDHGAALIPELLGEPDETRLAGVSDEGKHRLSTEAPARHDAVEAADEASILPDFHGMGISLAVQTAVGFEHRGGDPAPSLPGPLGAKKFLLPGLGGGRGAGRRAKGKCGSGRKERGARRRPRRRNPM